MKLNFTSTPVDNLYSDLADCRALNVFNRRSPSYFH